MSRLKSRKTAKMVRPLNRSESRSARPPANVAGAAIEQTVPPAKSQRLSLFDRYLTVWVFLCIVAGIGLGHLFSGVFQAVGRLEVAEINLPVAVLIWLMIVPMLLKVDLKALKGVVKHWRGVGVTLLVNWGVKPFSMALLGWVFVGGLFRPWLPADQIDAYIAGLILLAAAPCTAMVFVWSHLIRQLLAKILNDCDASLAEEIEAIITASQPPDYPWLGNIRELEQCIRQICIRGTYIFPLGLENQKRAFPSDCFAAGLSLKQVIQDYCRYLYSKCGSYEAAAKAAGIDRRTLKKYLGKAEEDTTA